MARTPYQNHNEPSEAAQDTQNLAAGGHDSIALPSVDFIRDASIVREGPDLVLETPAGGRVVIEGYFNADPAPVLLAPGGEALGPELVNSFVQQGGALQYAETTTLHDQSPVGAVHEITGKATVTRADGMSEPLTIGSPIYEGDIIETSGDGAVNIIFIDESSFAVSQNARLAIDEYVFDPASESGTSDFSILRGLFVFTSGLIGRDDPDDVEIDTPMGSIGIRGTVIAGNVDTGEITVLEGAIVVRGLDGSEITLARQFETARFDPATGSVTYEGPITSKDFDTTFDSVKTVAPGLFATWGSDAALDNNQEQTPHETTTEPATVEPQAGPAEPSQQPADMPQTDSSFDGGSDSGFDQSAGTADGNTTDQAAQTTANGTDTNDTAGTATAGDTAGTAAGTADTAADTTTQQPPPSVITPPVTTVNVNHTDLAGIISGGATADGFFIAGAGGQKLGDYVSAAGDFNNDGQLDFYVAENKAAGGKIKIYNGDGSFQNQITGAGTPTTELTVAAVGDLNGDGSTDFMSGAPDSGIGSAGNIQMIVSGQAPVSFSGQDNESSDAGARGSSVTDYGDMLGESVAGLGDINGDGYNDMLIGAPGRDFGASDDAGIAYIVKGAASISTTINADGISAGDGFSIDGAGDDAYYGGNVAGAGDLDNDGYMDFMISRPGADSVDIFFGDGTDANIISSKKTITGVDTEAISPEIPLFNMGDMNGDGITDIAVASTNNDGALHIFSGTTIAGAGATIGVASADITITPGIAGYELVGASGAGDFNGDGSDDAVLAFQNGTMLEMFVFYGGNLSGNVDMNDLMDPANAFRMSLDLSGYNITNISDFDVEIANPGDLNGDGFEDILIGMDALNNDDGGFLVVNGRNDNAMGADGRMVHIAGQTTTMDDVIANANGQHLVGNTAGNQMDTNGFAGVSMRGGDGDDLLVIDIAATGTLDGGNDVDKLDMFGVGLTLDFSAMGSESIENIEKMVMNSDSQTIRLGLDDIFRLMQSSQDFEGGRSVLKIADLTNGDGSGTTTLEIVVNPAGSTIPFSGSVYGLSSDVGDVTDGPVTFDQYNFGTGYALLIDQNIDTVNLIA
ncbi:MAG: FG-GAP repeat protein [Rhodospirillales bacterium]|nr:FG-GAP repeat protein [Rhodospirillales bacterium]MCB9996654.1 FG-GAP repeat protein [Rhodospirillales bacterium]